MDLHKRFQKLFLFRKYRIFWWFFKQYKHSISNTTYELTNISYVDVFQNTCILREPVNQGKSYSVTVAVYFWMNQTTLIFWKCNVLNNVWHVNTTGCTMLMNGDECCFVSYIFNVMVFNWVTTAPGRFRRLVRGCDKTLENPLFSISMNCSLLPRPEWFVMTM